MEQSASDAANAGTMVVRTTEDTPVGDGDPICELANVDMAIEAVTASAKAIARVRWPPKVDFTPRLVRGVFP
jgi:hypothetical protein